MNALAIRLSSLLATLLPMLALSVGCASAGETSPEPSTEETASPEPGGEETASPEPGGSAESALPRESAQQGDLLHGGPRPGSAYDYQLQRQQAHV